MVRPPDCTPGECGSQWAWLYFFSFYLAVSRRLLLFGARLVLAIA